MAKIENQQRYKNQTPPNLKNQEWLYRTHVIEQKNPYIISKMLNCSHSTVTKALKSLGIKLQKITHRQTIRRPDNEKDGFRISNEVARDVYEGSMLGDAWLTRKSRTKANFLKRNKQYSYIFHVTKILFGEQGIDRIRKENNARSDYIYKISSLSKSYLLMEYEKWYETKEKQVPKDFKLNHKKLLYWFMDDGSCSWRKQNGEYSGSSDIHLSTDNFNIASVDHLVDQLKKLGIDSKKLKHGKRKDEQIRYIIYIRPSSVKKFFDIIGPCPEDIPEMQYKWKIPYQEIEFRQTLSFDKLKNKIWLEKEFPKKSIKAIAKEQNCDTKSVRYWLDKHQIPRPHTNLYGIKL